jgi:5-methylcytosine-specific restriction protein B
MNNKFENLEELIAEYFNLVQKYLDRLEPYAEFSNYLEEKYFIEDKKVNRPTYIKYLVEELNKDDERKLDAITRLWASKKNESVLEEGIPQYSEQLIHSITPRANTLGTALNLVGKNTETQKKEILEFANKLYKMIKSLGEESQNTEKDILALTKAQREVLFWYYYNEDKYPIINQRAEGSRKILMQVFDIKSENDFKFNLDCLLIVTNIENYKTVQFNDKYVITKQLILDQLFYTIDAIKEKSFYCDHEDINDFYKKLWNTIKEEKAMCFKEKSEIIESYFKFFVKNSGVEEWIWYKSLKKWIDILQKIKNELKADEIKNIIQLDGYISSKTNQELKNTDDFLNRYLFLQDNGTANIGQGFIYNDDREQIKKKVKDDFQILLAILENTDPTETSILIEDLIDIQKKYKAVRYRFLKTLFPTNFTSVEAENKFDRLASTLKNKLNIQIGGKTYIDKHNCLMQQLDGSTEEVYKKHIFYWELYYMLENDLDLKKAIVYYGAPGTGKTYKARKEAKKFIDSWALKTFNVVNQYLIETVQFHPSFSYEDFIEGIRPTKEKTLELKPGIFKSFCKKAGKKELELYESSSFLATFKDRKFSDIKVSEITEQKHKEILNINDNTAKELTLQEIIEPAFFIIDEINRAELSRVFGELMYSLEYRGYRGKIKTQYSYLNDNQNSENIFYWHNGEDWFFMPQNVYIIGTMNTIDRSVDSFDFALRRRFMWEEIEPDYEVIRTRDKLNKRFSDGKNLGEEMANSLQSLNELIAKDELLGRDYRIGHSYVLAIENKTFEKLNDVKNFLWHESIKPLMQEYLRGLGDSQQSNVKLESFKKSFGAE